MPHLADISDAGLMRLNDASSDRVSLPSQNNVASVKHDALMFSTEACARREPGESKKMSLPFPSTNF